MGKEDTKDSPSLGLGFEFEWWEATLYDDLENEDHPCKDFRTYTKTGKQSGEKPNGAILAGKYDKNNPAPDSWNPNENRMPTEGVINGMLKNLRETIEGAIGKGRASPQGVEHPEVDLLDNGVSSAFTKYTAHRDDGRERNLAEKPRHWRKDTHVYEQYFYFVALEMRTSVYMKANQAEHGVVMRSDLHEILKKIPEKHNVSVNAGNDAWYHMSQQVLPGEARAGMHIHVSAEGVFDTVAGTTNGEIMGKRIRASKRLLTLYWLVEPDIMRLHASWRSDDSRYAGLLRRHSNLAFSLSNWDTKDTAIKAHWGYEAEKAENESNHHYSKENFDKDQGQEKPNDAEKLENERTQHPNKDNLDKDQDQGKPNDAEKPENEGTQHSNKDNLDKDQGQGKPNESVHEFQIYEKVMAMVELRGDDAEIQRTQKAIKKIWMCKNMDQLVWLCSSHFGNRRGAISLNQLLATNSRYKGGGVRKAAQRLGTVEFRAMQGSLNYDAVVAWSEVIMKMVGACVTQDKDDGFVESVKHVLQEPESGDPDPDPDPVKDFMRRLGFSKEDHAYKFYNQDLQKDVFDIEAKPRLHNNKDKEKPIMNIFIGRNQ